MIRVLLEFIDKDGDTWTKDVAIYQPRLDEIIDDHGQIFRVTGICHVVNKPILTARVEGTVKGNIEWELGHERGWTK